MINAKLEDIIQQKVYGVKPLFKNDDELPKTRFLVVSYSKRSPILEQISKFENLFFIDVNKKLKETSHHNIVPEWGHVTRTSIVATLSLIRYRNKIKRSILQI